MYKIEKQILKLDSYSENYFEELEKIEAEIQSRISELKRNRIIALFPMQSSKDEKHNQIGLEQERNAILFLSTPQSSSSIKSKVINCLELNKVDFVSLIFEKLVPQIPRAESDWYNLDRKNPDKVRLYRFIQSVYKTFSEKRGIDLIDAELKKLDELLTTINIIKTKKEEVLNANSQ